MKEFKRNSGVLSAAAKTKRTQNLFSVFFIPKKIGPNFGFNNSMNWNEPGTISPADGKTVLLSGSYNNSDQNGIFFSFCFVFESSFSSRSVRLRLFSSFIQFSLHFCLLQFPAASPPDSATSSRAPSSTSTLFLPLCRYGTIRLQYRNIRS